MTKPNTTYKPLGDYIRKIDKRNQDLVLTKPMGINIDKQFMPSVANVIGTDMSNYKLVGKNQFACNLMHVGRDGKIPVAINTTEKEILVSPAYHVFEIVDKNALSPDFLMMWFHREEFDREASFYTDADVRSGMDFKALMEMRIPVPPITEQRAVVADYEAVARRIAVAKRTIATLQATAQTLYRKMFVDGIDKENLPEGWRWGTLGEVCEINPTLSSDRTNEMPFVDMDSLPVAGYFFDNIQRRFYSSGMKFQNNDVLFARITPCMENGKAAIVTGLEDCEIAFGSTEFIVMRGRNMKLTSFLAILVRSEDFRAFAKAQMKGTDGRQRVDANALKQYKLIIPDKVSLINFETQVSLIFNDMYLHSKEIEKLTEIQTIILSGMGR